MTQRGKISFKRHKDCETSCRNIHSDPENPLESQTHESYSHDLIPGVIWIDRGGFVSLLFGIGVGYLNDNMHLAMELILDVGHFYVASYPRKKNSRSFTPVAAMPHVTVVIYRNSVETVCNLRLVKLNYSSACFAAIEMAQ